MQFRSEKLKGNSNIEIAVIMQELNYEQAFLTHLEVYSRMFGVRWVVNLCHTFIMNSLAPPPSAVPCKGLCEAPCESPSAKPCPEPPETFDIKFETDSLSGESLSFIPAVEEVNLLLPTPPSSPVPPVAKPEPVSEPEVKILRLKKSAPLYSPTPSSPQAKQILKETVKKTSSPKKRAAVRDMTKLVKSGLLPQGTKVVPSAPEIKPDIYGIIQVNASGKVGIQPSWNPDTLYIGKSNAPTQFLAAVNKQFPSQKVYGRENAWNDLLKVNPTGGYVSLADLWLQSR